MNTPILLLPLRRWVLVLGLTLSMTGSGTAKTPDLQTALDQWLGQQPGGVAAAYVDATGVTFFNAGRFSAKDARPLTPDTQFEIGSLTKVFTAILLADAVRENKVTLASPIGMPFAATKITYLQLATHTSGLPRLPVGFMPADPVNPYADYDLTALTKAVAAAAGSAKASPAAYSNFGFAVLGEAVAGAWGESYGPLLTRRVLQPLGLNDTVVGWRSADAKRLAPGHNDAAPAGNWDMSAFAPAGALVSTPRDLARFVQACLRQAETPLAAVLADTLQPRVAGESPALRIGLGWMIEQRGESMIVWHNGGTGGFRSFLAFDAAAKRGVVLLTNHTTGLEDLGFALVAGQQPAPPKTPAAPTEELKEYLGNYPLAPSFVMAVTADGGQLLLQATNQPRLGLTRVAADRYSVGGAAAEVSFDRDAAGKVAGLVLHQGGADRRAPRLAPGEVPVEPKEVSLTAAQLADYVGSYQLGPVAFSVTLETTQLMAQLTGQPRFPIFASAKDEFFLKVVNAQLSFVRDGSGKVTALILHQNGLDQRAERAP